MNWYRFAIDDNFYPLAGGEVSGLRVTGIIPNTSSIRASFVKYRILPGIRELSFSDFGDARSVFYAADDFDRSDRLAEEISGSGWVDPLIIAVDSGGPYILEGAHRFVALLKLGKTSFPALVVIDKDDDPKFEIG